MYITVLQKHVWKDISIRNWKSFIVKKQWPQAAIFPLLEGRSQSATPPIERIWKLFHSDTYWQNIETEPMATSAEIKQLCFLSNSNTKINTLDFKKSMLVGPCRRKFGSYRCTTTCTMLENDRMKQSCSFWLHTDLLRQQKCYHL